MGLPVKPPDGARHGMTIFDRNGRVAGTYYIPDDVMTAARLVSTWMRQNNVASLAGLTLGLPPSAPEPLDWACPKCHETGGGDWSSCIGRCPIAHSPHYRSATAAAFGYPMPNQAAPFPGRTWHDKTSLTEANNAKYRK